MRTQTLRLLAFGGLVASCLSPSAALAVCETAGKPFVFEIDRTAALGATATYSVGETSTYTVHCAPPFTPIYWSSTLNGASTGEVNAYYGHMTDANGHWSSPGGVWLPTHRGHWTKTATVAGQSVVTAFKVLPALAVSAGVDGGSLYTVGQQTTFTITAAPAFQPIYWSSTLNGASTGEVNAYYGHMTDANGYWSAPAGAWLSSHVGGWSKTATIGNLNDPYVPKVSVGFQVISSTEPVPPYNGTTVMNDFSNRVGVVDWHTTSLLDDAANKLASMGGHALRLLFSAKCNPQGSLVDTLLSPEIQEALNTPNLKSFLLTTLDRKVCAGNTKAYVDPTLYDDASQYNAVVADYRDLTIWLYWLYRNTGKKFILSNWESDNVVYCSAAYAYATDASYRAACDANYPLYYRGVPNPATALQGLKRWFQARHQGVVEGRAWAATYGYNTGVEVSSAIEFNIVNALKQPSCTVNFSTCSPTLNCTPPATACVGGGTYGSVLCDVVPYAGHDTVTYSAYESTNISATQLTADLNRVRNFLGTSSISIGEFGYSLGSSCSTPQNIRQRSHAVFQAALSWGVPYIYQWVMLDNPPGPGVTNAAYGFGVFDYAWNPQAMACYLQNRFAGFGYPWGSCN